MSDAAVLTVLWIDSAEQRHYLIPAFSSPLLFRRSLKRRLAGRKRLIGAPSPDDVEFLISGLNGTQISTPFQTLSSYRYLLTFAEKRRRVLLSGWRREGSSGAWQRLWWPGTIRAMASVWPPSS